MWIKTKDPFIIFNMCVFVCMQYMCIFIYIIFVIHRLKLQLFKTKITTRRVYTTQRNKRAQE